MLSSTESQSAGDFKPRTDMIASIGSNNSLIGLPLFRTAAGQRCASCLACIHSHGKQSPLRRGLALKEPQYSKLGFEEPCRPLVWNRLFLAE